MFIYKKTSTQASWRIASTPSIEKSKQQSSQAVQSKACFFKIFVTDSNSKYSKCLQSSALPFCYSADFALAKHKVDNWPIIERPNYLYFGLPIYSKLSSYPLRKYSEGSKSKLLQAFLKTKRIDKQNYFYKKNYQIIRPLLYLSRTEISLICKKLLIPVYPDKSNQCIKYSRNRIRKQLLPSLKLFYNPQIEQALFQFSEFLWKEQNFICLLFNAIPHNFLKIVKEKNGN